MIAVGLVSMPGTAKAKVKVTGLDRPGWGVASHACSRGHKTRPGRPHAASC